jgi:hypothetical protein
MDLSPIEMNDTKDNTNFIYYVIEVVPSMYNVTLVCKPFRSKIGSNFNIFQLKL